jgi:hypothetical protein
LDHFIAWHKAAAFAGSLRDTFDAHPAFAFVACHPHILHALFTFGKRHEYGKRDIVVTVNELLTK